MPQHAPEIEARPVRAYEGNSAVACPSSFISVRAPPTRRQCCYPAEVPKRGAFFDVVLECVIALRRQLLEIVQASIDIAFPYVIDSRPSRLRPSAYNTVRCSYRTCEVPESIDAGVCGRRLTNINAQSRLLALVLSIEKRHLPRRYPYLARDRLDGR